MKSLFKKAVFILSSLTAACSSSGANGPETSGPSDTPAAFEWTRPLEYEYVDEDNAQLKKYTKVIEQNLKKNEKASPVFRLGNLMFFEIKHAPDVADAVYRYRSAAVGLPNVYYDMPDASLFKIFSEAMRSNMEALESYVWIHAMIMLSTGNPRYLQMPEDAPTWQDKEGKLEIVYFRLRSNGIEAETKEKCVLAIDAEQKYSLNCQDVVAE